MRATLICPDRATLASVDLDREGIQVEYDFNEWRSQCTHPGVDGPTMCPSLQSRLLLMLNQANQARNGRLKLVCFAP
jgi:hypothetical protein